ncbi:MAG: hypothetical protein K940chlam1_00309 [Candidatus Anoxychlamydiales bacterium]|nr:hypothetical protein [Candidatus Anoxychlamydiales bacterium]NGX36807.1 hypothetical protein [Candidatus Anoxychlamydiales bacterium]
MASRADSSGKRVHFDSSKEEPTQRDLLDRKAAESRIKDIGECGNGVIQRSNPYERAPVGTNGPCPIHRTPKFIVRSISPPVEIPFSSTAKSLNKSGFTLGPPRRVPVKKEKDNGNRLPDRARVGERT